MFKSNWANVLAGFLFLLPAYAQAPQGDTIEDVRCVIVGMKLVGSGNSTQQSAGMMDALYYIGRLDGREPKLDIEVLLAKEFVKMTPTDFSHEATRCGGHLTEKGKEITKMGEDMTELGRKMLDKTNPPRAD
jgi:hypothetical protein